MSDDIFNVFSAIGIGLTFITSIIATIVSYISLKYSNKTAERSDYLNTITLSRNKWQDDLREKSSSYFMQLTRLCNCQEEENVIEIYNEITKYHFAIILLTFKQDKNLHNEMNIIRDNTLKIIKEYEKINLEHSQRSYTDSLENNANHDHYVEIKRLCNDIVEHQDKIFDCIQYMLENEWRKQQYEASEKFK